MITFELSKWGDGSICLYHEDVLNGQDIVITLNTDGTVHIEENGRETCNVPAASFLSYLRIKAEKEMQK